MKKMSGFCHSLYMYCTHKGNKWFSFIILTGYKMCLMQLQPLLLARQDVSKCTELSFLHMTAFTLELSQYLFVHSLFCAPSWKLAFLLLSNLPSIHPFKPPVTFLPNSYYLKKLHIYSSSPRTAGLFSFIK